MYFQIKGSFRGIKERMINCGERYQNELVDTENQLNVKKENRKTLDIIFSTEKV